MKIDNKYIEKGLVTKRHHPEFPELVIYNYTDLCAYEREWDETTLMCRGLIINEETGEVIAKPFPKFFNHNEPNVPKFDKTGKTLIMEKYDGSLGILYWYNDKPAIATRGSFESDQAKWATKYVQDNIKQFSKLSRGLTFLFEIIYPENRIVLNYDFSGLVCIGAINIKTGQNMVEIFDPRNKFTFKVTETYSTRVDERDDKEGYVVYYPDSNNWVKYKHAEYIRLHRLISQIRPRAIWDLMREGMSKDLKDLMAGIPDELHQEVDLIFSDIATDFMDIDMVAYSLKKKVEKLENRKEQAEYLKEHGLKYLSLVFSMLDGKMDMYRSGIYKMIKPKAE